MGAPDPVFSVMAQDPASQARAGILTTPRGQVETPVFMPVATQGCVKTLAQEDMESLGVNILLANAYHLYLRPGTEVVEKAGGLHAFMDYPGAILTDSGGFQVMSLAKLRTLSEEGVTFRSHIDGSSHTLTPESVIDIQRKLGSDLWTSLDECVKYPCERGLAQSALERTMRWTERAFTQVRKQAASQEKPSLFFPIIQGSVFRDLRQRAAEHLDRIACHGVSIGGISVGEPKALTWETVSHTARLLPPGKPRYLMGVGAPEDLWDAVAHGVDMMDCVWPTRVARHGMVMLHAGRINLLNAAFRQDFGPLDAECDCRVCARYSRAYLSHLLRSGELTAMSLLSYHNLHFLLETMRRIRSSILQGRFQEAHKAFLAAQNSRNMLKSAY